MHLRASAQVSLIYSAFHFATAKVWPGVAPLRSSVQPGRSPAPPPTEAKEFIIRPERAAQTLSWPIIIGRLVWWPGKNSTPVANCCPSALFPIGTFEVQFAVLSSYSSSIVPTGKGRRENPPAHLRMDW